MESFLKKVIEKRIDAEAHRYFIRFGKGQFNRRFLIGVNVGKDKIKIKTSFELANDLVKLCAELGGGTISGVVLSKQDISDIMSKNGLTGNSEEKRGGLFYKNNIPGQMANGKQIMDLVNSSYFSLIGVEGKGFAFKTKQSLPKPGKDEEKIDDKFCSMELDKTYLPKVREVFAFDAPEFKRISIEHDLIIEFIEFPKDEKDPVKIREMAVRKGKIVRRMDCDGKEISKEYVLSA